MSNKIEEMTNCSVDKMKEIINADTIIGKSITTPDGTVIVPVSKVTYGFASGGSDFPSSNSKDKEMFGGGNGVGVSIIPVAFLVISGSDVKLMQVESFNGAIDRIISMTPDIVDKICKAIKKRKESKKENKDKE